MRDLGAAEKHAVIVVCVVSRRLMFFAGPTFPIFEQTEPNYNPTGGTASRILQGTRVCVLRRCVVRGCLRCRPLGIVGCRLVCECVPRSSLPPSLVHRSRVCASLAPRAFFLTTVKLSRRV